MWWADYLQCPSPPHTKLDTRLVASLASLTVRHALCPLNLSQIRLDTFWVTWKNYDNALTVYTNRDGEKVGGMTTMWFQRGIARFTDLLLTSTAGVEDNYKLLFVSCYGVPDIECARSSFENTTESHMTTVSRSFVIGASDPTGIVIFEQPRSAVVAEVLGGVCELRVGVVCVKMVMTYPVTIELVDVLVNRVLVGFYFVCVSALKDGVPVVGEELRGVRQKDIEDGLAIFDDLSVLTDGTDWRLNFTLHDGQIYSECSDPAFASVVSDSFIITFNTADRITTQVNPSSALAGVRLSPPPLVSFVDKLGNIVTAANCPGTTFNQIQACSLKISIQIFEIVGGINRARPTTDHRLFFECGPNQVNAIGFCTERSRKEYPVILGLSNFTDVTLQRAGNYRLTFFSQLLITNGGQFYVAASRPTFFDRVVSPGSSTCKRFNASSDIRCEFGGDLDPPPTFKLWDRFDNLCVDGSFEVAVEIEDNPGKGVLVCPDTTTGTCFAKSTQGQVVFPGLSIDQMGIGYTLHLFIPKDGLDEVGQASVRNVYTPPFNLYALRYMEFLEGLSVTPVQCPVYPFPRTKLFGYDPSVGLLETDITEIPVDDGVVSVQGLSCSLTPTGHVTVESRTESRIRGTYEKLGPIVNGQPIYQQQSDDSFYLYVCDGLYNASGCGNRFWALSTNLSYCDTNDTSPDAYFMLQNCRGTENTPDKDLSAWSTRTILNGVASWAVTDSYSVVIKQKTEACDSKNAMWGSTVVEYVAGESIFRDVKLNSSGTYNVRFITSMTGAIQSVPPLDTSYDVIKNVLSGVDIVQQPAAAKRNFFTLYPPRVIVRDFTENPVLGWTCVGHICRSNDGRFNISAEIWRTSPTTGQAIGIMPAELVPPKFDNVDGWIEFGFMPTIAEKRAFIRFKTTSRSSCGERQQGVSTNVVETILFDVLGDDPSTITITQEPPQIIVAGSAALNILHPHILSPNLSMTNPNRSPYNLTFSR